MEPARNIELKARLHNLAAARIIAQRVATEYLGVQQQTDTYFYCPQGRLKLREIVDYGPRPNEPPQRLAQLISYDRPDELNAKQSDYQIVEITDPARAVALKREMGIRVVVAKRREIFLHDNVRIHLDEVTQLGTFLEFEAVLGLQVNAAAGHTQLAKLQQEFGIEPADLLATSYSDMLQAK
ncbi:MAG TPA: class IV adenylate cyclase [Pirellulales bacterium]|jgi:predicted adenylyl cyclase CyaB|nr:class IV adenylate cyclase [Pirellulales bacterium]